MYCYKLCIKFQKKKKKGLDELLNLEIVPGTVKTKTQQNRKHRSTRSRGTSGGGHGVTRPPQDHVQGDTGPRCLGLWRSLFR